MKKLRICFLLVAALFIAGCVSPIPLEKQLAEPSYKSNEKILIAVIDLRERIDHATVTTKKNDTQLNLDTVGEAENESYVRDGSFLGVAHGAYGIPMDISIAEYALQKEDRDKSLSELLQNRIVKGLKKAEWNVEPVDISEVSIDEANKLMNQYGAKKLVALVIHEWYVSLNLNWVSAFNFDADTETYVFDIEQGKLLSKRIKERNIVPETYDSAYPNLMFQAYKEQLDQILNDDDLKKIFIN